jgi:hypothetical protein
VPALHEVGHALGLGHSDNPNDVMYPYYKMATTLADGDKTAIPDTIRGCANYDYAAHGADADRKCSARRDHRRVGVPFGIGDRRQWCEISYLVIQYRRIRRRAVGRNNLVGSEHTVIDRHE